MTAESHPQPSPPSSQQTAVAAGVPGLDPVALAKLNELDPQGRLGVVQRVLAAFESSLARMLAQLEANGAADINLVSHIAHTLKSSSASVGASRLAQACADTERRCRQADHNGLPDDVQRLQSEGRAALLAVRAMLHDRTAVP
jgi:histidine phosphotransfer protein HptB